MAAPKKDIVIEDTFEIDDDVEVVVPGGPVVQQLDDGVELNGGRNAPVPADNVDFGDGRFDPAPPMATTRNVTGEGKQLVDYQEVDEEVELLPLTVEDRPPSMFKVRVHTDVGPVFYGQHEIELKKGVLYRVPDFIIEYLRERNLIWSNV